MHSPFLKGATNRFYRARPTIPDVKNAIALCWQNVGIAQSIYENDFVGSTRNALAGQNHRDRKMIEEDSSSGRWHRSHRLQSHVRSKGWQLRWITARHMVSSKRQSHCRQRMTLYMYYIYDRCYDFIVLRSKMCVPAWSGSSPSG